MGKKSAHARKHDRERRKSLGDAARFHGKYVRYKGKELKLSDMEILACVAETRNGWGRLRLTIEMGGLSVPVTKSVAPEEVELVTDGDVIMARLKHEEIVPLSDKLPKNQKLREKILYKRRLI